jgi:hypothetical protein
MSTSLYYQAERKTPLSQSEITALQAIASRFAVDHAIETYVHTGVGYNWESFDLRFNPRPSVILEGVTKLPDNTEDAMGEGVQHWCACLSELRKALPESVWRVTVDDHEILWNGSAKTFDLECVQKENNGPKHKSSDV